MVSGTIEKVVDIDAGDRQDIEDFLQSGIKPLAIHRELPHVPTKLIRSISAGMKMRGELGPDEEEPTPSVRLAPVPKLQTNSFDMLAQAMQMRKDQIAMEMLEEQIVQMREDSAHRRKTREMELRIKELEIREREMELEDEQYPEEAPAAVGAPANPEIFPNMARNSEYGWILDILQFANTMKNAPARAAQAPAPLPPPMNTEPDFSKPLSKEQIRAEIQKFPPEQVAMAAKMPKLVEGELKKRYPNITPENINTIVSEIKSYGNNAQ
jgi:hypothetical protein